MSPSDPRPPLVVIVGPTAVGKTHYAIALAQKLKGEIISADSRLFYAGMDIGTAKPTQEELRQIPHHLVDVAQPNDIWSLEKFQQEAKRVIREINKQGKIPFLVGGTGQYIRAITEGWQVPKMKPNKKMRKAIDGWQEEVGGDGLHNRLAVVDPEAAAKIDPRNVRRTVRALEVIFGTGRRFSEQRRKTRSDFRTLIIGLNRPRPELYQRIDERIEKMLEDGFVQEVKGLLDAGYSADLPSMSAIGYKQIADHLAGNVSLEEAVVLIKRLTRQYVRRQANWFKPDDPNIHWFEVDEELLDNMLNTVETFLSDV